MRWREIKKKYPNQWVAIMNFKTDPQSVINSMGEVISASKSKTVVYKKTKHMEETPLSIEFTGERLKNFFGGIWLLKELK